MATTAHRHCIDIAASPDRVWRALTDTAESANWYYDTGIESSFEPGAAYRYAFGDGTTAIEGIVTRVDPPRLLDMTFHALWDETVVADAPTRVIWSIAPDGAGSLVCVMHEELVPGSATDQQVASGWPELLGRLKEFVECA